MIGDTFFFIPYFNFIYSNSLDRAYIHIHIAAYTVHASLGGILPHIVASCIAALVSIMGHPDAIASRELGYVQVV